MLHAVYAWHVRKPPNLKTTRCMRQGKIPELQMFVIAKQCDADSGE